MTVFGTKGSKIGGTPEILEVEFYFFLESGLEVGLLLFLFLVFHDINILRKTAKPVWLQSERKEGRTVIIPATPIPPVMDRNT